MQAGRQYFCHMQEGSYSLVKENECNAFSPFFGPQEGFPLLCRAAYTCVAWKEGWMANHRFRKESTRQGAKWIYSQGFY